MVQVLRAVELLERLAIVLARWCAWLAAIGIGVITVLLVTSTLQRYLLNRPIPVTEELGGLLFLGIGFLSLAYGFACNRHVRLELLWRYLPHPWREILEVGGYLMALFALYVLVRETGSMTRFSIELAERTEMTELLLWPWRILMPACLGLFAVLVALRAAIIALRLVVGERPPRGTVSFGGPRA